MADPQVLRWEDVSIRAFVDEQEQPLLKATDFTATPEVAFESAKYQGQSTPTKDATFNGWSGSATVQLPRDGGDPMDMFTQYIAGVKGRTNTGRIRWVVSYNAPGGVRKSLRLENMQISVGFSGSDSQRITFPINFEAEDGLLS